MTPISDFQKNNFDLVRLFAALQVVLYHTAVRFELPIGPVEKLLHAFPGVPIFFAMSGFLISASLERSSSLRSYARNRVLRLVPALWACLGATAIVAYLLGFDVATGKGLVWLLAQCAGLIYTPGFLRDFGFGSYNGALWTIPIEMQFYAALPVVYWLFSDPRTRNRRLVALWVPFAILAFFHLQGDPLAQGADETLAAKLLRYSFLPHFYLFLAGVCFQRFHLQRSRWIRGRGLYWLAAYLALTFLLPESAVTQFGMLLMLAVVAISLAYTAPTLAERTLRGNDISYGIYIYHGLLHNVFITFGYHRGWVDGFGVIVLTLLVGYLSWVLIERPFMRRKRGAGPAVPGPGDERPVPAG